MHSTLILVALAVSATDLQQVLDRQRADQDIPGVSAVVTHRDETLFAGASGKADLETGREMSPDTVIYAGSLSKILTTVVVLQIVEEGGMALDDEVPGLGAVAGGDGPRVRLHHLLTHTSGLAREGDFGYWFNAGFPDGDALAGYLARAELRTPPGAATSYSNIGFAALGLLVERADDARFGEVLRRRVLAPLGMLATDKPRPAPNVATDYTPVEHVIPNADRPFAGVGRAVGDRHVREYHDARAMTPAFGLYTTASDFGRLLRFLLGCGNDAVLSGEMRRRMLTDEGAGRGLGLGAGRHRGRPVAQHGGWFAAHRSYVLLDIDSAIGVAVFANTDGAAPPVIARALLDAALAGEPAAPPAADSPRYPGALRTCAPLVARALDFERCEMLRVGGTFAGRLAEDAVLPIGAGTRMLVHAHPFAELDAVSHAIGRANRPAVGLAVPEFEAQRVAHSLQSVLGIDEALRIVYFEVPGDIRVGNRRGPRTVVVAAEQFQFPRQRRRGRAGDALPVVALDPLDVIGLDRVQIAP